MNNDKELLTVFTRVNAEEDSIYGLINEYYTTPEDLSILNENQRISKWKTVEDTFRNRIVNTVYEIKCELYNVYVGTISGCNVPDQDFNRSFFRKNYIQAGLNSYEILSNISLYNMDSITDVALEITTRIMNTLNGVLLRNRVLSDKQKKVLSIRVSTVIDIIVYKLAILKMECEIVYKPYILYQKQLPGLYDGQMKNTKFEERYANYESQLHGDSFKVIMAYVTSCNKQ